jgi:membrane protein implicated in regulation of membrane protease activity
MTIDEVTTHATGHVFLLGKSWLAATTDGITIAPGTAVQIAAVKGTTLTVKTVTIKENQ